MFTIFKAGKVLLIFVTHMMNSEVWMLKHKRGRWVLGHTKYELLYLIKQNFNKVKKFMDNVIPIYLSSSL